MVGLYFLSKTQVPPLTRKEAETHRLNMLARELRYLALAWFPAASILAWLLMEADGARSEQIARKHLDLNAAKNLKYGNKRQPDVLDQRELDWIDKLLSEQIQSAKTSFGECACTTSSVSSGSDCPTPVCVAPQSRSGIYRQRRSAWAAERSASGVSSCREDSANQRELRVRR